MASSTIYDDSDARKKRKSWRNFIHYMGIGVQGELFDFFFFLKFQGGLIHYINIFVCVVFVIPRREVEKSVWPS